MDTLSQILITLFLLFAFGCADGTDVKESGRTTQLTLENTLDSPQTDVPIVLPRDLLEKYLPPDLEGMPVLYLAAGTPLPVQVDDLDEDGRWDELALLLSFEASETKQVTLNWQTEETAVASPSARAHAYLGYRANREGPFSPVKKNVRPTDHEPQSQPYLYQFEGPGWESDRIAFRTYFDARNGKDIFGKTTPEMWLDSMGTGEDYHRLQPWGMDVLKVGNSLGAGALALLKADSLYRLGATQSAAFHLLADGPYRAVIRLDYGGWMVAEENYDLQETITIWGGSHCFDSQVTLKGGSPEDTLVTGMVNFFELPTIEMAVGKYNVLGTYGLQSEHQDQLGMGILVPTDQFAGNGKAPNDGPGITHTAYVQLKRPTEQANFEYCFCAGWEAADPAFGKQEGFEDLLKNSAQLRSNAIKIRIKN